MSTAWLEMRFPIRVRRDGDGRIGQWRERYLRLVASKLNNKGQLLTVEESYCSTKTKGLNTGCFGGQRTNAEKLKLVEENNTLRKWL